MPKMIVMLHGQRRSRSGPTSARLLTMISLLLHSLGNRPRVVHYGRMAEAALTPGASGAVQELRHAAVSRGAVLGGVTNAALARLLRACPDVDLATTALTMEERPAWLGRLLDS